MCNDISLENRRVNGRQRIDNLCMLFFFLKPRFFKCPFSLLIFLLFFYDFIDKPESYYNIFCITDSSEIILVIMQYAIFYIAICANVFILLREYLSDSFYIQRFFYPLLITSYHQDGRFHAPTDQQRHQMGMSDF